MKIISLQSGSNGNCTYVESRGAKLLFDAGISGKQAAARLSQHDRDINHVDALLISHDHSDHVSGLGIYQRKFNLPAYISPSTLDAAKAKKPLGALGEIRHFSPGETVSIGDVSIETIPTPHDASDSCAFVIDDGKSRLGIFTDLGHIFAGLIEVISTLDAVLIESNYDLDMLARSDHPPDIKRRIKSLQGHLSNEESAKVLLAASSGKLRWACLGHLSKDSNTPQIALATHSKILGDKINLHIASRYEPTAVLDI